MIAATRTKRPFVIMSFPTNEELVRHQAEAHPQGGILDSLELGNDALDLDFGMDESAPMETPTNEMKVNTAPEGYATSTITTKTAPFRPPCQISIVLSRTTSFRRTKSCTIYTILRRHANRNVCETTIFALQSISRLLTHHLCRRPGRGTFVRLSSNRPRSVRRHVTGLFYSIVEEIFAGSRSEESCERS